MTVHRLSAWQSISRGLSGDRNHARKLAGETVRMFNEAYEIKGIVGQNPVLEEMMKGITPEMITRMLPAGSLLSSWSSHGLTTNW